MEGERKGEVENACAIPVAVHPFAEEEEEKEEEEAFRRLSLPVGDVPVLFSDKFQQSNVLLVSLIQFIYDFWTFLFVQQRHVRGSMVQKTVVPQLPSIEGRRLSFRAADAHPHGPDFSADHGDSAVAAHFGGRCPSCAGRANSQVLPWRRPWHSHSCSSLRNRRPLFSRLQKTTDFPQLQSFKVAVFLS